MRIQRQHHFGEGRREPLVFAAVIGGSSSTEACTHARTHKKCRRVVPAVHTHLSYWFLVVLSD